MTARRVVVVGASLAGATTAIRLRQKGFDGEITLVGEEAHPPYERPALSKGYLAGTSDRETLLIQSADSYREQGIDLLLGARASRVDVTRQLVHLEGDRQVPYDDLVLATGSANIAPPIPGLTLPGVHQLRTIDDADRLAAAVDTASTAVVVGMGFIGCEVAATLRGLGLAVTMVDRLGGPLLAQIGQELSARVRDWHESHGVQLLAGADVAALEGDQVVERVVLVDGRTLPADLVVVGVGARPATEWLADAPLHLVRGAVGVDELGRTSAPGVHAAGDVAAVWSASAREHRRTEHYRSAIDQGQRVADAMLGLEPASTLPSWFWSDQYDHVLHYAGDRDGTELHLREDPYTAFFLRGSRLAAVAAVDNGRDFRRALRLLGRDVDPAELTSPGVDLRRVEPISPLPTAVGS